MLALFCSNNFPFLVFFFNAKVISFSFAGVVIDFLRLFLFVDSAIKLRLLNTFRIYGPVWIKQLLGKSHTYL